MMDNQLSNLKHTMKKTVFKDLLFSEDRKNAVKNAIRVQNSSANFSLWNEKTLITVLTFLQHELKTGYDISTKLIQKQKSNFQGNEGQVYTLLHLLENKEILSSKWSKGKKYYFLTSKGREYIATHKQKDASCRISLTQLIEGESL